MGTTKEELIVQPQYLHGQHSANCCPDAHKIAINENTKRGF